MNTEKATHEVESEVVEVLLVEDNPGDARLIREKLLEVPSFQHHVTHVGRLSEARRQLANARFDVALLDLVLPDKPRMGSLIEIYDQSARLPIVVSLRDWMTRHLRRGPWRKGHRTIWLKTKLTDIH